MHKGQKMPEALKKKMSEWAKAHPSKHWFGTKPRIPTTPAWRNNISKGLKRAYEEGRRRVHKNTSDRVSTMNKGKFGKLHPKWTEDKKHPFHSSIRSLHEYGIWRSAIFKRDSWTCTLCGEDGYVEADHYPKRFITIVRDNNLTTIEQAINCKELWEAEGRTLCRPCHLKNMTRLS